MAEHVADVSYVGEPGMPTKVLVDREAGWVLLRALVTGAQVEIRYSAAEARQVAGLLCEAAEALDG